MPGMKDFLPIGSTTTNAATTAKRTRASDASDVTKYIRMTAQMRPYLQGGPRGDFLPKGGYWPSQELRMSYTQGRRWGPYFDGTYFCPQN